MKKTGFQGTFAEFLTFLRTDPRFYAPTAEELLKTACAMSKKADGSLPALFGRLPRLPYTVEPVPAHLAPKYTGGRYVEPPADGTRPGIYWVNTYALDKRPLYTLEALTLHEAVPGHHLQVALSQELTGLPQFRRFSDVGAFGEGWALYSEWLGREAGFYQDPYSEFGRLTYEMWRACRLVVDTGLHSMGWTRAAGHRLPGLEYGAVGPRVHDGNRPVHLVARPGALLQDGGVEDPGAAEAGGDGARRPLRCARVP